MDSPALSPLHLFFFSLDLNATPSADLIASAKGATSPSVRLLMTSNDYGAKRIALVYSLTGT